MKYYKAPCLYDDIDREYLSNLAIKLANRSVIIYGAGYFGKVLADYFTRNKISVCCFCDQSDLKQGRPYCGRQVVSPLDIATFGDEVLIVIAVARHTFEIRDYLLEIGISIDRIVAPVYCSNEHEVMIPVDAVNEEIAKAKAWKLVSDDFTVKANTLTSMSEESKVIVHTIVFNTPPFYLRRAIESVLNQTYGNFIYLIIDNGSTDSSSAIMKEYAKLDNRIIVRTFRKNSTTLRRTSQKKYRRSVMLPYYRNYSYICYLDSDDYYEPRFIEETLRLLVGNNADIAVARTMFYKEDMGEYWPRPSPMGDTVLTSKQERIFGFRDFYSLLPSLWGKMYRTWLFCDITQSKLRLKTYKDGYRGISDYFYNNALYFASKRIVFTDLILHNYTRRENTISSAVTPDTLFVERFVAIYEHLKTVITSNGFSLAENSEVLDQLLYEIGLGSEIDLVEKLSKKYGGTIKQIINRVIENNLFDTLPRDIRVSSAIDRLKRIAEHIDREAMT